MQSAKAHTDNSPKRCTISWHKQLASKIIRQQPITFVYILPGFIFRNRAATKCDCEPLAQCTAGDNVEQYKVWMIDLVTWAHA